MMNLLLFPGIQNKKKVKKKKTKNVKVRWCVLIRGINAITTATEMVELVLESMSKNIIR